MKNKYKVVALVPLEFSVEGNSDSKEAIESVKTFSKRVGMITTARTSFLMASKSHFVTTVSSTKLKPPSLNLR